MDKKSLMQLYQRLIQGESSTCSLINSKKLFSIKKNYTSSQLATIRFSDEYLELIDNEKVFNETIEALKYFYTSENNNIKQNQISFSPKFYNFLFEHLFSHSEKELLEKIVEAEFSGKKSARDKFQGQRTDQKNINMKNQNSGLTFGQKDNQSKEKHVFFELLESILWDEESLIEKELEKDKKERKKGKVESESKEFSVSQMMSMFM